jgi:hypothetical protein
MTPDPAPTDYFPHQIHANCRIRRVYFSDRLYSEEELPAEFKLYLPVQNQSRQQLQQQQQQVGESEALAQAVAAGDG